MTGLCRIYRMSERTRRVNVWDEQTPFVNRETDGMLKGANRKAGGGIINKDPRATFIICEPWVRGQHKNYSNKTSIVKSLSTNSWLYLLASVPKEVIMVKKSCFLVLLTSENTIIFLRNCSA